MSWIESHQSLLTHRKTGRASRSLGVSKITVIGHLHALWWWCLDNAQDGKLDDIDIEDVADGAYWEGDPAALIEGLVFAGFLDRDESGLRVHHWMDYAGKLIEKRKSDAERKRNSRHAQDIQAPAQPVHWTSTGHPSDGAGTLPYPTLPNLTEPEEEEYPQEPKKVPAPPKVDKAKLLALFGVFYAEYPNKQSRPDAEKGWLKLNPSEALYSEIMAGLAKAKRSEEWHEEGGKYIPYPASFLSRRRWEDTYAPLGSRPLPRTSPPVIGGTLANPDFVQEKFPAGFRPHTREEAIEADRVYYRNQQILKEGAAGNAH